jgi:indole-3-glycerol phosphate synthase
MPDILADICATKRDEVAARRAAQPWAAVEAAAHAQTPPRGFMQALLRRQAVGQPGFICEIKRASPSGGLIRPDFDPAACARAYDAGGASCLSVLTDQPYFQGTPDDLVAARAACGLPVLRKDFMLDPWQVAEARAMGADCILLIMAALSVTQAAELAQVAAGFGMDVLVEVHDAAELEQALDLDAPLIGVNNRNLKTLVTDLSVTEQLSSQLPHDRLLVSESGIRTAADVARLWGCGARAFLVGESLLRQPDLRAATQALHPVSARP